MDSEAYEGAWWGVIMLEGGALFSRSSGNFGPLPEHRDWAEKICQAINYEAHYLGVWAVFLFPGGKRMMLAWMDGDGDLQVLGEEEGLDIDVAGLVPMSKFVEHACEMVETWADALLAVDPKPEQQVHLAAGEKPTTDVAAPILMVDDEETAQQPVAGGNGRFREGPR